MTLPSDCEGADQRTVPWAVPCDVGAVQAGAPDSVSVSFSSPVWASSPLTVTAVVHGSDGRGTVRFSATLNGAAATVPASCSSVTLVSDKSPCTFSPAAGGTLVVSATYSGDATYAASEGSASVLVNGIELSFSSPSQTGTAQTVTATAIGVPVGRTTVDFTLTAGPSVVLPPACSSVVTFDGVATCTFTPTQPGNYTFDVVYRTISKRIV